MSYTRVRRQPDYLLQKTPVGWLGIVSDGEVLLELLLREDRKEVEDAIGAQYPGARRQESPLLLQARKQVDEFFAGRRWHFDLPLDYSRLSPFSSEVLQALARVPFGQTLSYGELAKLVNRPQAARAVGRAMAANPFVLLVPCHRVIGRGGGLTGYSGGSGIASKQWLLDFEKDGKE